MGRPMEGHLSMKHVCAVLAASALGSFASPSFATADDVAVIVHKSNPVTAMTVAQLRMILLGAGAKWPDGNRITVVLTPAGQPERTRALRVVCGMSETDFNMSFVRGWRKPDGSFNGVGAERPTVAGTGLNVRESVASTPYAVGLINASQVDDSVQVVAIDGSRPGTPAYKIKFE
jgi:hypothetical protein